MAGTLRTVEEWGPDALRDWGPASFPTGDGGTWTWAEPEAKAATRDGWLELSVERFTRAHDRVQIFDNPKHLLACARPIPVPPEGLAVEADLAARMHGSDGSDWSDGFASLNLMDFATGLVVDGLANGRRTAILLERLHIPGAVPEERAFTAIADGPPSAPGEPHRYRFEIDPAARRVQGFVDGRPVLDVRNLPDRVASVTPGFGLITLRPIAGGRSTSLRGQGATGRLGPIRAGPLR